ncbi:IS1096 element passenger TnpR family protein [Plebeiibacterium sediminum]|uniref:Plasmid pRiA4b ORF-3 family protein n=1 Tax=Plebeiibacterium sediminum TaxID=2992112 RepID=A0AAE3M910_9BACT|nr:hypothetical protein [Plebeiobacterium sediminum]MCW3789050.1 plasmid pRiA4b ORF-3 family protein [Plebeiobacterium sediminum]
MTIRLRLISGEDEDFIRDIEVGGEATFFDLHNFIQELLNFDEGQMASFFITDEEWQKQEEITLMDMAMDETSDSFIMADTKIGQFVTEAKQRLLYVFDFFNERNLFMECYEVADIECSEIKCIYAAGNPPEQLDLSDLLGEGAPEDDSLENPMDFDDEDYYNYPDTDFDNDPMISFTDDLENL